MISKQRNKSQIIGTRRRPDRRTADAAVDQRHTDGMIRRVQLGNQHQHEFPRRANGFLAAQSGIEEVRDRLTA